MIYMLNGREWDSDHTGLILSLTSGDVIQLVGSQSYEIHYAGKYHIKQFADSLALESSTNSFSAFVAATPLPKIEKRNGGQTSAELDQGMVNFLKLLFKGTKNFAIMSVGVVIVCAFSPFILVGVLLHFLGVIGDALLDLLGIKL